MFDAFVGAFTDNKLELIVKFIGDEASNLEESLYALPPDDEKLSRLPVALQPFASGSFEGELCDDQDVLVVAVTSAVAKAPKPGQDTVCIED